MSIYVLHQNLTPQEEDNIATRTHLALPFEGIPDLSVLHSELECRHLLQALHPDEPPEAIARRLERIWKYYTGMHEEDIIVVPLKSRNELALAEVTGRYVYQAGPGGSDVHMIPVRWYDRRVALISMAKHRAMFDRSEPLYEIVNPQARIAIRDKLPHGYNRFAKWKWLMALFFALSVMHLFERLFRGQ